MNLNAKRISQLGRVVTGKTPPTSHQEFFGGEYLFVTPSDLQYRHYYCRTTERTVTEDAKTVLRKQFVPADAVMFTCIGATIGKCGIAPADCLTNQQINSVVANADTDSKFLYYLLCYNAEVVRGLGGGAATPIVSKAKFEEVELLVPPLHDQQAIADILSAYDDLIENNRRRMALLEDAAQQLYREWFVRLRFPGHEHTRLVDGVPEGWERLTLGHYIAKGFVELQTGPFGTQLKASDYTEAGTPVINVRNIGYGNLRGDKLEFVPDDVVDRLRVHVLASGDIVFGRKGAVDRHLLISTAQDGWIQGSDCIRLRTLAEVPCSVFLSFGFREQSHKRWMVTQCSNKATMASLNQDIIARIPLLAPNRSVLVQFHDFAADILKQIGTLQQQSQKAVAARDLLLPRLMSGEIAV